MNHNFRVSVDWDQVPTNCQCEYTGVPTSCLPVFITYWISNDELPSQEKFIVSTSVCDELESGYLSAEEFYNDIKSAQ